MKLLLIVLFTLLAACTNRDVYEALQENNRQVCNKMTEYQRQECLHNVEQNYEDFKRERDALKKQK